MQNVRVRREKIRKTNLVFSFSDFLQSLMALSFEPRVWNTYQNLLTFKFFSREVVGRKSWPAVSLVFVGCVCVCSFCLPAWFFCLFFFWGGMCCLFLFVVFVFGFWLFFVLLLFLLYEGSHSPRRGFLFCVACIRQKTIIPPSKEVVGNRISKKKW